MESPLALGETWTQVHLFETILLATVGPEAYNALWSGEGDWAAPEVTQAIENVKTLMNYVNSDYATLSWQDASKLVADGDAAFNIMGDWADGYFYGSVEGGNLGLTPLVDYAWMPVPGTQGVYQFLSDSFVLPVGAKNRDAAIKWLELCGSKEGQDAFNPIKGSIPARKDADKPFTTFICNPLWRIGRRTLWLVHSLTAWSPIPRGQPRSQPIGALSSSTLTSQHSRMHS